MPAWLQGLSTWHLTSAALAFALFIAVLPDQWRTDTAANRYTVVLQAQGEAAKTSWVVHLDSIGSLRLQPLQADQIPADRSVQVWTLIDPATAPRSRGLVEVTLEPACGSPKDRPPGKVLYIGRAVMASAN